MLTSIKQLVVSFSQEVVEPLVVINKLVDKGKQFYSKHILKTHLGKVKVR